MNSKAHKALLQIRKACTHTVTQDVLNNEQFGAALRKLREDREISLRSMAKIIGVSPAHMSDMELGHRGMKLKHQLAFVRECLK